MAIKRNFKISDAVGGMVVKANSIVIGIDPDCDKSGVAVLMPSGIAKLPIVETLSLEFPKLLDFMKIQASDASRKGVELILIVEAGWLNKSNWHIKDSDNKKIAGAKGNATGRNHETGRKIVEMCKHYGIDVIEQRPLKKIWKGKDGKITHIEIKEFTRIEGRTNQEERDALLLAWSYMGLPQFVIGGKLK